MSNGIITRLGRWGLRKAGLLRAISGMPAGVARRRRGTVLVIIMGALALIAVLTIVYVSVGQSDRRSAAATQRVESVDLATKRIADYIAQVIADAAMSVQVQGSYVDTTGATRPLLVRPASDYPFTDPSLISILNTPVTPAQRSQQFNPTGSYDLIWGGGGVDPRVHSSPYLSSTLPTIPTPAATMGWFEQITNIGPSGQYANLWNLAPKDPVTGARLSAWNARVDFKPGLGPLAPSIDSTTNEVISYLSWGLTLLDSAGNPNGALKGGGAPLPNVPAHWSMYQNIFRPARGPMFYPGNPAANRADSPWYAPYQFCDTDGDGFFDARWFALEDGSDPLNIRSLLPRDDRFRWFAAVRVVDLTGMVNVNTATDQRAPARQQLNPPAGTTQVTPQGIVPEVDFRRLLIADDFYSVPGTLGYAGFRQPATNTPEDYGQYDRAAAFNVGSLAYDGLQYVLQRNSVSVPDHSRGAPAMPKLSADQRRAYYVGLGSQPGGSFIPNTSAAAATIQVNGRFGVADTLELLTYRTINDPLTTSRLEQATGGWDISNATNINFGPLRENRGWDLESWTGDPYAQPYGGADMAGMARAYFDLRQLLTGVNGARPLRASIVQESDKSVLRTGEIAIDAVAALKAATTTTPSTRDPSILFHGYAEALMPYSSLPNFWKQNTGYWTTCYGGSPEQAIRAMAHLTVNMIDGHDKDHDPTAVTLLLDESQRGAINRADPTQPTTAAQYPWWNLAGTGNTHPGRLDLGTGTLANPTNGDPVRTPVVNIYGIEAQPVLTEVAFVVLYTDTPEAKGGDSDYSGDPNNLTEITVNGTFGAGIRGNPDFLGEFIAFQLTNPFDVDIDLTQKPSVLGTPLGPAYGFTDYYIEYGGKYYDLMEMDESTSGGQATYKPIVLKAGESRVFYALSNGTDGTFNRWRNVSDASLQIAKVQRFVEQQFAMTPPAGRNTFGDTLADGRLKPRLIPRVDAASGVIDSTPADLVSDGTHRTVHLWRAMRSQYDPEGSPNKRENDMLVDRLRDPEQGRRATLQRTMPAGNHNITGTRAGQEPPGGPSFENTGFTIALWGDLKRRDNPGGTAPRGAIPAYCVEARTGGAASPNPLTNVRHIDGATPGSLSLGSFQGPNAATTFDSLIDALAPDRIAVGGQGRTLINTITKFPQQKTADVIMANRDTPQRSYDKLYPELYLNDNENEQQLTPGQPSTVISVLRVTDLLMPLGIGPEFIPNVAQTDDPEDHPGYITLSEALGMALNYWAPANTNGPLGFYSNFGDANTGVFDRGNLALNRFSPFVDANANGAFDPGEQTRFPGYPIALHVLDVFNTMPADLGGFTKSTPGVVNINTMPRQVSVLLPLVTPTNEGNGAAWQAWLDDARGTAPVTSLPMVPKYDVGTALVAFRDRSKVPDRTQTDVNFEDSPLSPFNPVNWNGRASTTQILGIGETPGFAGRGGVLAVTDTGGPTGATPSGRITNEDQIDYLARDAANSGVLGTNTSSYTTAGGREIDGIPDNYAEKLLVASGLMNTITTRSDVFAVWFVVQGYQKSDTENLHPYDASDPIVDPLVPSVSKRFLMILDRSNVTRIGQKPKVLLLTELPMNP